MADPRSSIVQFAGQQIGKPYVWGATGPNGYDCSGLVFAAYKAAGVPLPRELASQLGKDGAPVLASQAQPGDVVYYDEPGSTDHVGIYIGNGKMIDAPYTGAKVRIDNVGNPTSYRRILPASGPFGALDSALSGGIAGAVTAAGDVVNKLNPFANWQSDVMGLVLKAGAAVCVAALVVVGAQQTVKGS